MTTTGTSVLRDIVQRRQQDLLDEWLHEQLKAVTLRLDLMSERELCEESAQILGIMSRIPDEGTDLSAPGFQQLREALAHVSERRAELGFTPSETATFVFSLKQPLFARMREELGDRSDLLVDALWQVGLLMDRLGLYTTEVFQRTQREVIARQQREMLELSTPVTKLWDSILALPLIGTLDSERTQVVMENLLSKIAETSCQIAIIDITGVPAVDTQVAQHLLQTISAARLMGVECIISGIRPQIAQTIVHLGALLPDVTTRASLADAFGLALRRTGQTITSNRA